MESATGSSTRVPLGTILDMPSGSLKNIMIERIDSMETTLAHMIPEYTSNIVLSIALVVYLFTIDVRLAFACLYFYLNGSMVLADCCTMLVCAFMLFNALDVGGNFSALLRTVDLCVEKANKILALPTMDIEGSAVPEALEGL